MEKKLDVIALNEREQHLHIFQFTQFKQENIVVVRIQHKSLLMFIRIKSCCFYTLVWLSFYTHIKLCVYAINACCEIVSTTFYWNKIIVDF